MPILVVEDNADSRACLSLALSSAGYRVLTAESGQCALDLLEGGVRPRLMLLDLMMPKVSGWDILKYLRDDPELRRTPVVVLTGRPKDEVRIVADAVIQKPAEPEKVVEAVAKVLASQSSRG